MIFESGGHEYETISHSLRRRDDNSAYIDIRARHILTDIIVDGLIIVGYNRKSSLELSTIDIANEATKLFLDVLLVRLESGAEFDLAELQNQYTSVIESNLKLRRDIREGLGVSITMYGGKALKKAIDEIKNGGRLI